MNGIGTLNETARNMFRGPRGVGAYQQFASGGEAVMSEAELKRLEDLYGGSMFNEFDLPVDGKVQYRKDRDGSKRFDAEIAKTFDGERGNITPSARYSTQSSSRSVGDVVIGDDGRQIGAAIEGELYLDPDSENKLRAAIDIENSRQKLSFTFPEGQLVQTKNGVLKKFNLGADLGMLGLDATYTDDSRRGTRAQGSATIKIGENGIVRYEDSSDGKPQFSAKYSTELGEGFGSFNYKDDSRNVPEYGAELNTPIGEGLGSLSYSTDGKGDRFGAKYTLNFASGGEAMGPPPTRGPDPQGIGYFQQFADGGPVYMQEGGPPSAGEIKSEILDAVYEAESNSNYDQWHLNAINIPEKPLTEMTVEEIMRYQGDNKGPAAGAGQIKFDTLQYLIDYGTIKPTDVFTVETQDKAHSRLLDRRGFQAWVSGEMSNTDFGQNVAKEYAGIPLLADEEVNGVLRPRGSSRYGGSNVARIGLDDWEGLLATAKTATPDYGSVAAVNSEAKSPFIETLTMRGEDVAMSMPVEQSERMSELGQENLADGRYFQGTKPEDVMTPSVGELLSSKYSRPRTQEAAEAKQRAMDRSKQTSLYEQFAPEGVQDLFSGIGSYIRGEEPQQEEEVNVYGSPPAKPPETFRKFLKPNSTIL